MHIFVWGSILSWLVVIPISSTEGLYGLIGFFQYGGTAFEVIGSATFWFYLPIATMVALAPTIIFRIVRLDVDPHNIDDVRLLQKKEGRQLFKRLKFHRKPVDSAASRRSMKRTGYAYSHTEGFGEMITTGRIFGLNEEEVFIERQRRLSTIISKPTSRATSPPDDKGSVLKATLAVAGVTAAVAAHGLVQEVSEEGKQETDVEIHVADLGDKKNEELKSPDESSPSEEENVKVDLSNEVAPEDSEVPADEGEMPPKDLTPDHDSSSAQLLPANEDSSSENVPGSVGSPASVDAEDAPPKEEEKEEVEGFSDEQEVLM